ncbi:MAG TPA: hydantoinase B/oxoprolinase family protein, partial [Stellaceae bacterium]|nr:hydantoinase B/oxoprolinase family protein [Stellaceae bacterium]
MEQSTEPGRLDPITVEVIRNKLDGIAKEMAQTLIRSAFSSIVKEANDASASLFTIGGETLAQAIAVPAHMATLYPMVSSLLKLHPVASMREGDIFILNDPYDGGSHLPDVALIMPVFHRGRPVALSTSLAHHLDIGGMSPGSVPPNATEVFQEGFRIPPMKYRDGGALNETLIALLKKNVRTPDILMGDLNAQVASCSIAARRLIELADAYGGNFLTAVFDELLNRSEAMTKEVLRSLPEGTYRYVDYLDNDGVDLEKPIRIEVAVTLANG